MTVPLEINAAGVAPEALWVDSPNRDDRPVAEEIVLAVIHNISLPPGEYGGEGIIELFTNRLDPTAHPYYATIHQLRVSAHFLIRRDGQLVQFVPCGERAWHAGVSNWRGRERCNDFSVGIELEGCDEDAFEAPQYLTLNRLLAGLKQRYPIRDVVGHSEIAPGRKTDPGPYFDWSQVARA
ncbi:MAG TPA: 1,6-anhydro-N-acetylmuramyl-L-alanine amidase AmpD [Methylophilaceae bacterium]|nr:1,6-anhydro-N-acetylmuramyl-L-alanine amidase AmpD [Methylophilaceae bacterium]